MLLGLQNVTFEFGARVIVKDATWHIQPNERIGLIGYNGTGKSTLLKVLTSQYLPSSGTVEKGKETTIGFLHQDLLSFDTEDSIFEVALSAFERVQQLEKEIEQENIDHRSGRDDLQLHRSAHRVGPSADNSTDNERRNQISTRDDLSADHFGGLDFVHNWKESRKAWNPRVHTTTSGADERDCCKRHAAQW